MTTILAIEDEPSILENILETLELGEFKALGAENGLIGVQMAREHRPDLIISDITMPEMDGYDVLAELRSDPDTATIPFIFLTARTEREAMRQAFEFGADDYLSKPFSPSDLLVAVTARLNRHSTIVQEQQQKLNELRGNLLLMLPHEMRTPLNAVLGYADLIVADAADMDVDQIVKMGQRIQKGGARLLHLIENYLLAAHLQIVRSDPEALARLVAGTTSQPHVIIKALAERKAQQANRVEDLALNLEPASDIRVAEDNFKKAIDEVLDNAFKFSKPGTPVQVIAAVQDDVYLLQIADNGRGMTQQQIANVGLYVQFERRRYEQQGSGLGLSLARSLAELHGGALDIESAPQRGTQVSIRLPLSGRAADEQLT